ncbi:MFS general substrate transporter [Aureobasidium sp. EXF-3400]|nr:MFS general substrate transporter [Aureobasidium sp. EXF-12344]KAI4773482.1 MFS general substrate transporter [Aureobasidium sp. EXF-3400]
MVTQELAIQSYYHQQDSCAERPEDIPLGDLSHQSSLQSPTNHYDEDDDDSSVHSFELYTPDEEKSLLRKLDTRLVLFLALLYMLSFLDRSNIGNAKVAGLSTSLKLSPAQFEWLLTGFYMSYICFEWMTLLYKIFPPHAYISICVLAWGCLASLQSVSTGFGSILILRILLGISEAAFGPGVPFYLSFFFKRNELAFRTGLFISAAPLASSFASTLAFAIVKLGKNTAIESWRILFIIEGFPSVLVAVWAWYVIPDSPSTAPWLSARERNIATLRLRKQMDTSQDDTFGSKQPKRFDWSAVRNTLRDPKSYLTAGCFFSLNVAFSSMPVFAPDDSMGYSAVKAQGLAAPPHLFAFVVVLVTSVISDRLQSRSIPIIIHASLAMAGYLLLALAPTLHLSSTAQYMCIFPITSGFFSAVTTVIVWTVNNQQSEEGRGSNVALMNVIGQLGPLLGTRLYPESDAPTYKKGHALCAGFMGLVALLAIILRLLLVRANASLREARTSATEDGAARPLVGRHGVATGDFEYML